MTPPYPEPVQAQQQTLSKVTLKKKKVTFQLLVLQPTITPEPISEVDVTALQQTRVPPKHLEVTRSYLCLFMLSSQICLKNSYFNLWTRAHITPESILEAEHSKTLHYVPFGI